MIRENTSVLELKLKNEKREAGEELKLLTIQMTTYIDSLRQLIDVRFPNGKQNVNQLITEMAIPTFFVKATNLVSLKRHTTEMPCFDRGDWHGMRLIKREYGFYGQDNQTRILHREGDLPAVEFYVPGWPEAIPVYQVWYHLGEIHREGDLPARIMYFPRTRTIKARAWHKNGKCHRDAIDAITGQPKPALEMVQSSVQSSGGERQDALIIIKEWHLEGTIKMRKDGRGNTFVF